MRRAGWHRADIVAAVHKAGTTLAELGRNNGLASSTLGSALSYPRKPSNAIIARFLGLPLHELWPAWFDRDGELLVRRNAASRGGSVSSQKRVADLRSTRGGR